MILLPFRRPPEGIAYFLQPSIEPTRIFNSLPFAVALLTPWPEWVIAAVTAHVWAAWSWMIATLACDGPDGGPSWITTPDSTPGRSTSARSLVLPTLARDRNRDQPESRASVNEHWA